MILCDFEESVYITSTLYTSREKKRPPVRGGLSLEELVLHFGNVSKKFFNLRRIVMCVEIKPLEEDCVFQ